MYEKFGKIADKLIGSVFLNIMLILIGLVIGFFATFNSIDSTPATNKDYKPLLDIQNNIIERFDNVYHYDNIDIDIHENNIVVFVYNDECSINIFFDENLNYLYTQKHDNIEMSKGLTITLSIISGLALSALFIFAFWLLMILFDFILYCIYSKK